MAETDGGAATPKFRRVLLKLSGEMCGGSGSPGLGMDAILETAQQLKEIRQAGVELAVVVGGGNLIRGAQLSAGSTIVQESTAHYMGMLATVINGLALQDALEHIDCPNRLMTAIPMPAVAEPFVRARCLHHLKQGRIVILAGGTGNPFVTTDTAAALRGCELGVDALLKATRVDGVYSDDPEKNPHAVLYDRLTYREVLERRLHVMDMTAIGLCMDNRVPVVVFNYQKPGYLRRAVDGERVGTFVGVE